MLVWLCSNSKPSRQLGVPGEETGKSRRKGSCPGGLSGLREPEKHSQGVAVPTLGQSKPVPREALKT